MDVNTFSSKILDFGFDKKDVIKEENVNNKQIRAHIQKYMRTLEENKNKKKKTLVVIYFAGHGVMLKNQNNIVVLDKDKKKRYFNLELWSRSLSSIEGSYIITIFDCCREYMPVPTTRGIGSNEEDAEHDVSAPENPEDMMHSYTNLILINGCAPNKTVPGYSFIAEGFLKTLEECRSNNGTLLIPDSNQILNTFRPNSEGNLTFEIAEPLLLHGPDPTEDQMPTKLLALAEKL